MQNLEWEEAFALLEEYKKEYGTLPKAEETYRGFKLGMWYKNQRNALKNKKNNSEQLARLEALGALDNWFDRNWEQNYKLLERFIHEFGRFPKDVELYEGIRIGRWCSNQKKQSLNPDYPKERVEKLKQIGLLDSTRSELWEEHYTLLENFITEFHRFPKNNEMYCGFNIGNWCAEQKFKARNNDAYPSYRMEKLYKIGLLDYGQKTLSWEEMYQLLEEYVSKYNKFPTAKEQYKGYAIGNWCAMQKSQSKNAEYPKERLQRLEKIGIQSTTQTARWEKHYQLVLEFVAEHERLPKQKETYRGERIGLWCTTQKQRYKKESYPEEHRQKLRDIGLIENHKTDISDPNIPQKQMKKESQIAIQDTARSVLWEQHYKLLETFIAEFHRFPKNNEIYCDFNIGNWCTAQKLKSRNSNYPTERFERLREIGLFGTTHEAKWDRHYQLVKEFVAEYGRLPKQKETYRGEHIGYWCKAQKQRSEKESYPKEYRQKLCDIGLI